MPDGSTAFQIDCSLEIQGASSTDRWKTDKLSMRLKFKAPYGPEELNYPIFGNDATSVVNTLILDATNQQSWTHPEPQQQERAQFIRDQFVSDLQNAAGGIAPTGSYAFVYLNGLFWGLYWIHEFVDDNFVATYRGGKKKDKRRMLKRVFVDAPVLFFPREVHQQRLNRKILNQKILHP